VYSNLYSSAPSHCPPTFVLSFTGKVALVLSLQQGWSMNPTAQQVLNAATQVCDKTHSGCIFF